MVTLPYTIKEGKGFFIFLGILIFFPFLREFNFYDNIPLFIRCMFITASVGALLFLVTKFMVGLSKIECLEDKIIYRTSSESPQELKYSNIKKISFDWDSTPKVGSRPFLSISTIDQHKRPGLCLLWFAKKDWSILLNIICTKNPQVEMDRVTAEIKQGNFETIKSDEIRQNLIGLIIIGLSVLIALYLIYHKKMGI